MRTVIPAFHRVDGYSCTGHPPACARGTRVSLKRLDAMVKKKLQVFVSSTFEDLKEERQAAVEAILAAGHIPAGMELFAAGDASQLSVIRDWIDESDVFLLILGGRYGSIEPESGKSYIHLEYEHALERKKPTFAVVIEDAHLEERVRARGSSVLELEHPQSLKQFRSQVLTRVVRTWRDPRDIKISVLQTLGELSRRSDLVGWIRSDQALVTGELKTVMPGEMEALGRELRGRQLAWISTVNN